MEFSNVYHNLSMFYIELSEKHFRMYNNALLPPCFYSKFCGKGFFIRWKVRFSSYRKYFLAYIPRSRIKRYYCPSFEIFRLVLVEKTRESDDEKKRRGREREKGIIIN